jgi:LmbE family N-acetylglucosaminyl deacetylase
MVSPRSDHVVDITDSIDRKIAALRCHVSQIEDPDALEKRVRGWTSATAKDGGLPAGRMAETFQVVSTG